jgi:putative Mg2+ transporter-C (MgtC) family protein
MDPVFTAYVLPIVAALLAGAFIGLEREVGGHAAGLRTHALVALASALLMLLAVHQLSWLTDDTPYEVIRIDPVRMAHGILTGIGFLCGGVIFRSGLSVHGLTTAASLWITSALGTLFGVGAYGLAIGGTVATLAVLVALRWVEKSLPQSAVIDVRVRYRRAGPFPEDSFHTVMAGLSLKPQGVGRKLTDDGEAIELGAALHGPSGRQTRELAERLCADPRVLGFEIEPRNP